MRGKTLVVATFGVVVMAFMLADASHAKNGGSSSTVQTKLEAELQPCCGDPEPEAEGETERETKTRNGVSMSDRFKGKVEIPVPSAGLGIADVDAAMNADIRLVLSHMTGGVATAYAECSLDFDEIEMEIEGASHEEQGEDEDEDEEGELVTRAEYKVDLRVRLYKGVQIFQQKAGSCADLTSTGEGLQQGIPAVQDGDMATARIVDAPDVPFLEGTFVQK